MKPSEKTDEELMAAYQLGDEHAFHALYARTAPKVFQYVLRKLNFNREQANDLHQSVFMKFHQCRAQYRSNYAVLQWLYVIAHTAVIDYQRKQSRQVPELDNYPIETIEIPIDLQNERQNEHQNESENDLIRLAVLTEEQRKILNERFIDEKTYAEIAQRIGRSEESVRQLVSRALRKVRQSVLKTKEVDS